MLVGYITNTTDRPLRMNKREGHSIKVVAAGTNHDKIKSRYALQFSRGGQLIEKRAPPKLGEEFTVAVPPCNSATRATTARPSP